MRLLQTLLELLLTDSGLWILLYELKQPKLLQFLRHCIKNAFMNSLVALAQLPITCSTVKREMWVTSQTGQILRTWATCKSRKTSPTCMHWSTTIPSRKMAAHEAAFMSLFTRQLGGSRTESFLIERGRAQLNSCCASSLSWLGKTLSTTFLPVTSLMWENVPGFLPLYKRREVGRGPGNEAIHELIHRANSGSFCLIDYTLRLLEFK